MFRNIPATVVMNPNDCAIPLCFLNNSHNLPPASIFDRLPVEFVSLASLCGMAYAKTPVATPMAHNIALPLAYTPFRHKNGAAIFDDAALYFQCCVHIIYDIAQLYLGFAEKDHIYSN